MGRYLRLYGYFLRFSLSRSMEFRFDFFFRIFMDLIYYGVNIAFYRVVFLHTPVLAGWNEEQLLVFIGCYLVVDAANMMLFSNNLWWLVIFVNRGDLDYYLVRPVSSLFMLSLRDFAVASLVNFLFAAGILVFALSRYSGPIGPWEWALFPFFLAGGVLLYYSLHLLTILPSFWIQSGRGLNQTFYNLARFMERPDRIYRGWARRLLLSLLPFGVMASFPARSVLDGFDAGVLLHFLLVVGGFFGAVLFCWSRALKAYGSASS